MDKELQEWYDSKPQIIKDLYDRYPPGHYVIKAGAPYAISCPGTQVTVIGWSENGTIIIMLLAENKMKSALEHERKLCAQHGTDADKANSSNLKINIAPEWLEPLPHDYTATNA